MKSALDSCPERFPASPAALSSSRSRTSGTISLRLVSSCPLSAAEAATPELLPSPSLADPSWKVTTLLGGPRPSARCHKKSRGLEVAMFPADSSPFSDPDCNGSASASAVSAGRSCAVGASPCAIPTPVPVPEAALDAKPFVAFAFAEVCKQSCCVVADGETKYTSATKQGTFRTRGQKTRGETCCRFDRACTCAHFHTYNFCIDLPLGLLLQPPGRRSKAQT